LHDGSDTTIPWVVLAYPHERKVRELVEQTILEIDELLRAAPPGAAVRELRVRHGALARVVRGWSVAGPHAAQLGAMQECLLELRAAVLKACPARPQARGASHPPHPALRPTARALPAKHMKTTRPPPRRVSASRSTRPPARRSQGSVPPSSRRG
jgi:hypothetical protein